MPPTSTHSVASATPDGNTPHSWLILAVAAAASAQRQHQELRAHRERQAWERRVRAIPGHVMSSTGKLVMLDSWAEARYRRERGIEGPHPIWIEGRVPHTGVSAETYGAAVKKQMAATGAVVREERPDPASGNKRVLVEFTDAFWKPELLHREEPRNQGGARKPKCVRCGSERFTPVAWECNGCGITYDMLPFPSEDPDPTPSGSPAGGGPGGDADPPTGKLPDHGYTQGGVDPNPQLAGWPYEVGGVAGEQFADPGYDGGEDLAGEAAGAPAPAASEGGDTGRGTPTGKLRVGLGGESEGTGPPAGSAVVLVEAVEEPVVPPTGKLPVGPPEELEPRPQWVTWRAEATPEGRPVKPPYRPSDPARRADVGDPATWGTYERALEASPEGRVGFVLTPGDPYAVADLDGCRDPGTGELEAWAREVVELLDSYTEISPSGKGLHVWVRGELPGDRRRSGKLELYDRARYVTVTGEALPGYEGRGIAERGAQLAALYRRLFGEPEASPPSPEYSARTGPPVGSAGDGELLGRAMRVSWFPAVWGGDDSHYGGDPSKGDYWVCRALALYGRDPAQIERLARSSPRAARAKSERPDYWPRTVAAALHHTPRRRTDSPPPVHTPGGLGLESPRCAERLGEPPEGEMS